MKLILHRYILKEQLIPLTLCFAGLSMVMITGQLMQIARFLLITSMTASDLLLLMALAMPKLTPYILSMATLIGVLLAFVRLSSDNELIAMRAAGVGFKQFLIPVALVAVLSTLISSTVTIFVMPDANKGFRDKIRTLGKASIPALLRERAFIDVIPDLVFFFEKVDLTSLNIQGVFIQDDRQQDVSATIVAESARVIYHQSQSEVNFKISNGVITRVGEGLKDTQVVSFKVYDLRVDFDEIMGASAKTSKARGEMNLVELLRARKSKESKSPLRYALEFHQRLALPVSCLFLGLLAAPLGALFRQGSRMTGISLGLMAYLVYYVVLSAGKGLGENGLLPPFAGIWAPNLLSASLALFLWIKVDREKPSRFIHLVERLHYLMREGRKKRQSLHTGGRIE